MHTLLSWNPFNYAHTNQYSELKPPFSTALTKYFFQELSSAQAISKFGKDGQIFLFFLIYN